jgi:hypothetical protein
LRFVNSDFKIIKSYDDIESITPTQQFPLHWKMSFKKLISKKDYHETVKRIHICAGATDVCRLQAKLPESNGYHY